MKTLGYLVTGLVVCGLAGALLLRTRQSPSSGKVTVPAAVPSDPLAIRRAPIPTPAPTELVARIVSGSGAPVVVRNLKLQLKYSPPAGQIVSFYNPSEYPTLDALPLASGQRASFSALRRVVFTVLEHREKELVPEVNRANYAPGKIDRDGFVTVTVRSIQAAAETPGGEKVVETLQLPKHADALLVGETAIGSFEKSLWGASKPVVVELERAAVVSTPGK
jgi:hypothetical protein